MCLDDPTESLQRPSPLVAAGKDVVDRDRQGMRRILQHGEGPRETVGADATRRDRFSAAEKTDSLPGLWIVDQYGSLSGV